MDEAIAQGHHRYGVTTIAGQATALLGDKYGDIFNIQQATILLSATTISEHNDRNSVPRDGLRIVRQNEAFPGYTLETITTFEDGRVISRRGRSDRIELRWERREDLGVGVFGEVHREELVDQDGGNCGLTIKKSRAVKVLRRRQLEHMKVDYKRELDVLIQLSQPQYVHRFVEFYSWYENTDNICLAMEYIPDGDLEKHRTMGLHEEDVKVIGQQILDGLSIMHRLDFIHRDIKPANVFIKTRTPIWWVKIGDFSISKSTFTRHTTLHTQVGTSGYQAPEVLGLVKTEKKHQYNAKCDIWSFGCLVYELLTRMLPFEDIGDLTKFCDGRRTIPDPDKADCLAASLPAIGFIQKLLQANPSDRPTADEALVLVKLWLSDRYNTLRPKSKLLSSMPDSRNQEGSRDEKKGLPPTTRARGTQSPVQDKKATRHDLEPHSTLKRQSNARTKLSTNVFSTPDEADDGSHPLQFNAPPDQVLLSVDQRLASPFTPYYHIPATMEILPIRFKDAVGRIFKFPWDRCCKWDGMQYLIHQAFELVHDLRPLVLQGRYDLIAPDKGVIMPHSWEHSIAPGMQIVMVLWPLVVPPPPPLLESDSQKSGSSFQLPKDESDFGRPVFKCVNMERKGTSPRPKKKSSSKQKQWQPGPFTSWILGG